LLDENVLLGTSTSRDSLRFVVLRFYLALFKLSLAGRTHI
jgi:hypothetical protein